MATSTTTQQIGRVDEDEVQHGQLVDCFCERLVDCCNDERQGVVASREVGMSKRPPVSRLAVEGGGAATDGNNNNNKKAGSAGGGAVVAGRTLPPPHAWLAIEDTKKQKQSEPDMTSDPEEQWMRLLRGGGGDIVSSRQQRLQQRRSSFSVVRRERAAREAWLDRAWEMKRSWHQRNGGAPDADTPVVVVVGSAAASSSPPSAHDHQHHQHAAGGVAMDVEEVRACRDLGLELPSDCTVEIQCYGLSAAAGDCSSPTHTNASSSGSGADSPCAGISSPGADPMDVKARLKAWAQAVALTSTTQLGS